MTQINMETIKTITKFQLVMAVLLTTTISGCGSEPLSEAEGLVTYKGKPLVCGAVIFVGPDGMTKGANIEEMTGKYHIKDVGSGTVGVAVVSYDPAEPMNQEKPSNPNDPNKVNWMQPNVDRSKWAPLPKHYELIHTSNLSVDLKPGSNKGIDIQLD